MCVRITNVGLSNELITILLGAWPVTIYTSWLLLSWVTAGTQTNHVNMLPWSTQPGHPSVVQIPVKSGTQTTPPPARKILCLTESMVARYKGEWFVKAFIRLSRKTASYRCKKISAATIAHKRLCNCFITFKNRQNKHLEINSAND